ncbi:MAG: hypothetical protein JW729_01865 [Bacteroidales bacterium]|nr:hypothetical protein [Bacteroidales bacterium]
MHWIDEAEQKLSKREQTRKVIHSRIDQKKNDVQTNWDENNDSYLNFLDTLEDSIDRVNNLPREARMEFGRIEWKEKKSSLQNHLTKFSSSRRKIIRRFNGILSPFKPVHYKNTRNIFVSLSRKLGYTFIEIKEIHAPRIRLEDDHESTLAAFLRFFKKKERTITHRAKVHIKIEELSNELALYCIDYLAFKNDGSEHFALESSKVLKENEVS